jgi:hypothetical protein
MTEKSVFLKNLGRNTTGIDLIRGKSVTNLSVRRSEIICTLPSNYLEKGKHESNVTKISVPETEPITF